MVRPSARLRNALLHASFQERVDWNQPNFPANFIFKMAETVESLMEITEVGSQVEENPATQDEDQRTRLTQFPQTRIRNMMKIDPDLHLANRESVFLLTRAAVSVFLHHFFQFALV